MMRAVLLFLILVALLVPDALGQRTRDFFGPTGHPYSGYVGGVEDELALLRLHFELTDEQSDAVAQVVIEHRAALEHMDQLMSSLIRDNLQRVRVAGGFDDLYAEDPNAGVIVVGKRWQIMAAQQKLESQMVERIRSIAKPTLGSVWRDYLITRDFERWRQPSEYDSLGETFDPLVLFHQATPELAADPAFREALREPRAEAHKAAGELLEAFQLAEEYSLSVRYRTIAPDGEREQELYKEATDKAEDLLAFLWQIPDSLFDDHTASPEALAYRTMLLSKQALDDSFDPLKPIESEIRKSELVKFALELPDLTPEQHAQLTAQWVELNAIYTRAEDARFRWIDSQLRGRLFDETVSVWEAGEILREADVDVDTLATTLTAPQWYIVLGSADAYRFRLEHAYERAIGFDWSDLDFEALIPE